MVTWSYEPDELYLELRVHFNNTGDWARLLCEMRSLDSGKSHV
jgi:hypothetical protein